MSLPILLTQLRVAGVRTLASVAHASGDSSADGGAEVGEVVLAPWDVDWCKPVALLVGNEGAGLPVEVEKSADARIRIPMASGIESLNAAAAAAVLFYEAARQRKIVLNIGGKRA
jgi:TrmH family RNA methyltransferase